MANTSDQNSWLGLLGSLGGPIRAIKLGPSIVAVLATLGAFGLLAMGGVIFLLRAQPSFALGGAAIVAIFVWLVIQSLLRFTKDNQAVAALGGGQFLQFLQTQMGSKNPNLIIDHQPSMIGEPSSDKGGPHE